MALEFGTTPASGSPTPAQMVALIKAALHANPAGVVSVTVDGQTVTYDRKGAFAELKEWERRAATAAGSRPRVSSINLSGF